MAVLKFVFAIIVTSYSFLWPQTGLHFLKSTLGVKEAGLSGAGVAARGDGGMLSLNPAGVVTSSASFLHAEHFREFPDAQRELFQGIYKMDFYAFGISAFYKSDFNIIPADDEGRFDSNATFSWQDFLLAIEFGRKIGSGAIGFSIKGFQEQVLQYSRLGGAMDFGAQYEPAVENVRLGFAVLNIGKVNPFLDSSSSMPTTLKAGFSYLMTYPLINANLIADLSYRPEKRI